MCFGKQYGYLQLPAQADGLAFDGDGVHILADAQDSRKCGVFSAELDMIIEQKHALEGGLAIDQDGGDLAVLDHRLAVNGYDIAVFDFRLHAVALAQQRKVGMPLAGDLIVGLEILLREDGCAAGNLPHTRDAVPLRQRLEARRNRLLIFYFPPHKVCG